MLRSYKKLHKPSNVMIFINKLKLSWAKLKISSVKFLDEV